jgi:hypothetical protein
MTVRICKYFVRTERGLLISVQQGRLRWPNEKPTIACVQKIMNLFNITNTTNSKNADIFLIMEVKKLLQVFIG